MQRIHKAICLFIVVCITVLSCSEATTIEKTDKVARPIVYSVTKLDKSVLMKEDSIALKTGAESNQTITVDANATFQTMDGMGYTMTGGSAQLINKMDNTSQGQLLNELFACKNGGLCFSYLRISIGASDLDEAVFSYNDLPSGNTDTALDKFSIAKDKEALIPVLKKALAINPSIKLLGSPWSAPVWMKDNKNSKGGALRKEYYPTYALYFVKYIKAMADEGLTIDAITIQNEPGNPYNNPSMVMTSEEQKDFIKNHLGPLFAQNNIKTKIIVWDHNLDDYNYPMNILKDADAAQYVDGSAFHLYAGDIGSMSLVHNAYPNKNLYFTEQWTSGDGKFDQDLVWHTRNVVIGSARNWAKTILEWNLANDPNLRPFTPGGCSKCLGALTIDGNTYNKNVSYYIIGQLSKYVTTGSKRISSSYFESIPNVAFVRPDGKKVLHILNEGTVATTYNIKDGSTAFALPVEAKSLTTVIWK